MMYLTIFENIFAVAMYLSKLIFIQISSEVGNHRYLAGTIDPSQTTVTGGIDSIEAYTNYTITVTSKDSSNSNRNMGGDIVWVKIENE